MPLSLGFGFCVRCYEPHKKPWSYCIHKTKKRIFQILAAFIFYLKSTFPALALELQFPTPLRVVLLCFATQSLQILLKCEVWSVKFQFGVRRAQCEVWSVKCEVWSVKEAVRSEKCEVCSVKCGVWRHCFVSRWKNQTVVEGRTRSGRVVFEL